MAYSVIVDGWGPAYYAFIFTYYGMLPVEPCSISLQYITKQLEYVTKDHIAMYTKLFMLKTTLFLSFLVV